MRGELPVRRGRLPDCQGKSGVKLAGLSPTPLGILGRYEGKHRRDPCRPGPRQRPPSPDISQAFVARRSESPSGRPKRFRTGLYEDILPGEEREANAARRACSQPQQKECEISGLEAAIPWPPPTGASGFPPAPSPCWPAAPADPRPVCRPDFPRRAPPRQATARGRQRNRAGGQAEGSSWPGIH